MELRNQPESSVVSRTTDDVPNGRVGSRNATVAKSWAIVSDSSKQWCRRAKNEDTPGMIYVKVPKTGSSTLVGINIRIAQRVGQRISPQAYQWWPFHKNSPATCSYTFRHGRTELLHRQEPYLLWSFVRDPAARALSEFYHFEVSRRGRRPTDLWTKAYLNERRNYQFLYLADHRDPKSLLQPTFPRNHENDDSSSSEKSLIRRYILQPYHFIGLLERKFESLAVIKLLWDLEAEDLIVLSAKSSGGYDDGRFDGSCTRIQQPPKPLSPFLKSYIDDDFHQDNLDYVLYEMINRTLDRTIQRLGADTVSREVESLKRLQTIAEGTCQATAIFPCSPNGTLQLDASSRNCYWTDSGCGHACVDEALQNK